MELTPEQLAALKDTNLGKIRDAVDTATADYLKGLEGMRQPSTRVRKTMLQIRTLLQAVRTELLEACKNKKVK